MSSLELAKAFGVGWASSDKAHLPELPAALARLLDVPGASITILHWNGTIVREFNHTPRAESPLSMSFADETRIFETSQPLGRELTLQIRVDAGPGGSLSNEKKETLRHAIRLIHAALERIFVQVKDPQQLGQAFQRLSGREWEVCLALESPHGEKEIAETLGCTRHTVHSYVKNLYRKLGVQSRMEVLTQLRQARDLARSGLVDQFVAIGENRTTTPASENVCGTMRDAG